jgi:hypothetical protein
MTHHIQHPLINRRDSESSITSLDQLKEGSESLFVQLEGSVVRYGQIIQLTHAQFGNKYLAVKTAEAAPLEQTTAKVFLRSFISIVFFSLHFSFVPYYFSTLFQTQNREEVLVQTACSR